MTTTFGRFNGTPGGNDCTLPTRDVEILADPELCTECRKPLVHQGNPGDFDPWQHSDGYHGRNIIPVPRCHYRRGMNDRTRVSGAWHDGVRSDRCGGEHRHPIGD